MTELSVNKVVELSWFAFCLHGSPRLLVMIGMLHSRVCNMNSTVRVVIDPQEQLKPYD